MAASALSAGERAWEHDMDLELRGKRAVITGGSVGIGLAVAHALAAEGVDVAIVARERMRAEREAEAWTLFASLLPVLRLLFAAPNPSAIKAMLAFDHPMADETRMPITPASAQLVERLRKAREALQDLRAEFAGAAN